MTSKTGGEAIQNYRKIVSWADSWNLHGVHLRADIKRKRNRIGLPLYLFRCGINGSGGMNVGDLRGGVDWWHRVLCGLSSAAVLV